MISTSARALPAPARGLSASMRMLIPPCRLSAAQCHALLVGYRLLAHHGEHVVVGHGLAVLVGDRRVPADLPVARAGAQRLFLARQAHADAVARLDRLYEAQALQPIVG